MTSARGNFNFAMADVKVLLNFHDQQSGKRSGKPDRNLEVFKRSGIILSVTAWEAFIEDTVRYVFSQRIREANSPNDLPEVFSASVDSWIAELRSQNKSADPEDVKKFIINGDWGKYFRDKLEKSLNNLNTPSPRNVRNLSVLYLGKDVTHYWRWHRTSSARACARLDSLITLRGDLVHKSKELFDKRAGATRADLIEAITLVENIARCTEIAFGIEPKSVEL